MLSHFARPKKRSTTILLSVVFTAVLTPLPGVAATLAESSSGLRLFNFSHSPTSVETFTPTFTEAVAGNSSAIADADATAQAEIGTTPSETFFINESFAQAAGDGLQYSAVAQGTAIGAGYNFFVPKSQTFNFDFDGFLNAFAATENLPTEQAYADSSIEIQLFGGNQPNDLMLIESLQIFGKSDRVNRQTALTVDYSDGFQIAHNSLPNVSFLGNFSRQFNSNTYLTLVESKQNNAWVSRNDTVQVPGPTIVPAFGVLCLKLRRRRRRPAA